MGVDQDVPPLVRLVHGPVPVEEIRRFVRGQGEHGGIVTFEGVTRREHDRVHGPLLRLEYEAYAEMAERQMRKLAIEAARRWSAWRVAVMHRVGGIPTGDVSVMIAVSCRNRAEAFEACRWLIDAVKQDVPIWKKDVFENGHTRWTEPATLAVR